MVWTWTHGIDNANAIELDSWYRIGTPESHMYERAECYPYAGFFISFFDQATKYVAVKLLDRSLSSLSHFLKEKRVLRVIKLVHKSPSALKG